MNGIFLINKPAGITSHDVVYKIKKRFNLTKCGHTGTLDPFATGLMIILVGQATRLAFMFNGLDKAYDGEVTFGKLYDTYDVTGQVLDELPVSFSEKQLKEVVSSFNKTYQQVPPIYSAIKIGGKKAYELARDNKDISLTARTVNIYDFKLISGLNNNIVSFYVDVSKGTYIRSLAYDVGVSLKTFAALKTLRRLKIGQYLLENAKTIEDVTIEDLISDYDLFADMMKVNVNDFVAKLVKNGAYLDERHTKLETPFIVVHNNKYLAYYEPVANTAKFQPIYLFKD